MAHPLPEINLPPSVEGPSPVLATPPHRGILAQVPGHKSGLHRKCDPEGTELGPSPEGGTRNLGEEGEDQTLPTPKSGTPKTCARGGHPHPPPLTFRHRQVHACLAICRARVERRAPPPRRHEGGEFYPGVDPPLYSAGPTI